MIKTIFVAYDGSDHALKAVKIAADISAKYRARLVIGHVLLRDAPFDILHRLAKRSALPKAQRDELDNYEANVRIAMSTAELAAFAPVHGPEDLLTEIGKQLVERATQAAKKAGAKKVSTALLSGDAADAILARAKKERSNLIVLGTRGLSELGGLLVGSVSHKVSTRSHCACMTVK